jgi:hypothetical protein
MKKLNKMTLSQKRKLIAATTLPLCAVVLMMGFQNCSPGVVQSSKLASTGTGPGATGNLDEDTKPVTVAYSETTLPSMQLQTGIQTPSTRTLQANTLAKTKFTETGKVDTLNAPGLMAVTNLAGEVCLDLITEEKAKAASARRFFNQVDFTKAPAVLTAANKSDLVRRMSRNFFGRNETVAEKTLILSSLDAAISDARRTGVSDATDTEDTMIYVCTAMLSSLDAYSFK